MAKQRPVTGTKLPKQKCNNCPRMFRPTSKWNKTCGYCKTLTAGYGARAGNPVTRIDK